MGDRARDPFVDSLRPLTNKQTNKLPLTSPSSQSVLSLFVCFFPPFFILDIVVVVAVIVIVALSLLFVSTPPRFVLC